MPSGGRRGREEGGRGGKGEGEGRRGGEGVRGAKKREKGKKRRGEEKRRRGEGGGEKEVKTFFCTEKELTATHQQSAELREVRKWITDLDLRV